MLDLIRAISKTGLGSLFSLVSGVITNKIFALLLGPSGIGFISLLRQIELTALSLSSFNGRNALVQGMASREGNAKAKYFVTVSYFFIFGGFTIAIMLFLFAPQIANLILNSSDISDIRLIQFLSVPLLLDTGLFYFMGVLNGHKAIGRLATVQVINSFVAALLAYPVSKAIQIGYWVLFVALMSVSSLIALIIAFVFSWKIGWFDSFRQNWKYSGSDARHFLSIASVTIITTFIDMGAVLILRAVISKNMGLINTGIFEVSWTLSMRYVTIILTSFATYYLPTLSQIRDLDKRSNFVKQVMRLVVIIIVPLIIIVAISKPLIVTILYSKEFLLSLETIRWMLIGDYFKVTSWVLAYLMLAFPDMKIFFWSEVVTHVWLILGCLGFVIFGNWLPGVGLSFMSLYIGYLIFTLIYAKRKHSIFFEKPMIIHWLIGLFLIVGVSVQTWNYKTLDFFTGLIWIILALAFIFFSFQKEERTMLFASAFNIIKRRKTSKLV